MKLKSSSLRVNKFLRFWMRVWSGREGRGLGKKEGATGKKKYDIERRRLWGFHFST